MKLKTKYLQSLKIDKEHENKRWEEFMNRIKTEKLSQLEVVTAINRMQVIDKKIIKEGLYELLG